MMRGTQSQSSSRLYVLSLTMYNKIHKDKNLTLKLYTIHEDNNLTLKLLYNYYIYSMYIFHLKYEKS